MARRIVRGQEKEVALADIKLDDLLLIKTGETLPSDGTIVEGEALIDESAIGGGKKKRSLNDQVFAGTINSEGLIILRVTAIGEKTLQSRIHHATVAASQTTLSEDRIGTRATKLIYPIAIAFAGLAFTLWYGVSLRLSILSAVSVLLATAPFLYKIKLQKVYQGALASLAEKGIIIKDTDTLVAVANADTVLFDKTGVLTTGKISVEHVVSFKPYTQQQIVNTAASLENKSTHPIGVAIVAFAKMVGGRGFQRVENMHEEPGLGISGTLNSKVISVGNAVYMQKRKIPLPQEVTAHLTEGKTVIFVAQGKVIMGYFVFNEEPLPEITSLMEEIKKKRRVVLFSADHVDAAAAFSIEAGMHEVIPVASSIRSNEIKSLKDAGKKTLYVTRAAKSEADITVSLGREFSDVLILNGSVQSLLPLFFAADHAHNTFHARLISANLYHIFTLPIAAVLPFFLGLWAPALMLAIMAIVTYIYSKK